MTERASELREATSANADQLRQVTANLATITSQLAASARTAEHAERIAEDTTRSLGDLRVKFGRFSFAVYIVWAVLLLALGSVLPQILESLFGGG